LARLDLPTEDLHRLLELESVRRRVRLMTHHLEAALPELAQKSAVVRKVHRLRRRNGSALGLAGEQPEE